MKFLIAEAVVDSFPSFYLRENIKSLGIKVALIFLLFFVVLLGFVN